MKRLLWTQKLSNQKLKLLLEKTEYMEELGRTNDEEINTLANTWYDEDDMESSINHLTVDIWKEAAFRWKQSIND